MKRTFRKILSLICIIAIILSISLPSYAGVSSDKLILDIDTTNHQALKMVVDSVASHSSLQAFCVGWNFTFSNSNGSVSVYVPLSQVDTDGGNRTYTFPMTTGWTKEFTGIAGGKSIRDLVSNKTTYDKIIKAGCTVHADSRIRKYSYSNGTYTPLNTYANIASEIDSNFSEFSSTFKTNTKNDYFNLSLTLAPEPVPVPDPSVILNLPEDGSTVLQGTTITFKGFGTGVHHIGGYINGSYIGVQNNPNEDINTQMKYETTVKLDEVRDYTFQIKGRNTESDTDEGSKLAVSAIHTVHVVAPAPNTGNIYITYLDYSTYAVVSSSSIPNVPYNTAKTVSSTVLDGYDFQGSYQTFATTTPDITKMTTATSQTVTLSATNTNVYVYLWYKAKPIVVGPSCELTATLYDQTVRAGEYLNVSGNTNDTEGHNITNYVWYPSGQTEAVPNGNSISLLYMTPGVYDLKLNVLCSALNGALATAKITVTEPTPQAYINVIGFKKENRKMTIDGLWSNSPDLYPMDWLKTTWLIEPVTSTGAKWEMGVKLSNGTVKTINQSTDQSFLKGQTKFDFQARYAGQYQVTITVTNSLNLSSSTTNIVTVSPDLAPVSALNGDTYVLRDQPNPSGNTYPNWSKLRISDSSYSPDGDTINKRIWGYRYNSNNNKDSLGNEYYLDEITKYNAVNSTSPFYLTERYRLFVDNDNDLNIELWTYDVGAYAFELTVIEDIPDSDTIKELLIDSDYRSKYVKDW